MAPLPASNTPRVYYTYANSLNTHTLTVRLASPDGTLADADAAVAALLSAIGGEFVASTITKVEQSASGDNARFPVASDRIGDEFGSGAAIPETAGRQCRFVGKSTSARRASLTLFGYKGIVGNFRIDSGESVTVAAAVNALQASEGAPAAIDGNMILWSAYVNIKDNDHWVKEFRNG